MMLCPTALLAGWGNEEKGNTALLMSCIRIPIGLCFLPIHSTGICMLGPIDLGIANMLGECMCKYHVNN